MYENRVSGSAFHQKWGDQSKTQNAKTSPCEVLVQNEKVKAGRIKQSRWCVCLLEQGKATSKTEKGECVGEEGCGRFLQNKWRNKGLKVQRGKHSSQECTTEGITGRQEKERPVLLSFSPQPPPNLPSKLLRRVFYNPHPNRLHFPQEIFPWPSRQNSSPTI